MVKSTIKKNVKQLIRSLGYDLSLHPIATGVKPEKGVAYIHIAKCGGSSIDRALRKEFASPGQQRINRDAAIETSMLGFTSGDNALKNSAEFGDIHSANLQTLLAYHLGLKWSYVSGHTAVNSKILQHYKEQYRFITVLRDPVSRFVSHYIYTKLTNSLPIMLPNMFEVDNIIDEAQSLLDSQRGWHMANTPTMCLTGKYPEDVNEAKALQDIVTDNLRHFEVVGFLNELDSFTQKISSCTNRKLIIPHKNSTNDHLSDEKKLIVDTLTNYFEDRAVINQLNRMCKFELENYKRAQDNFS